MSTRTIFDKVKPSLERVMAPKQGSLHWWFLLPALVFYIPFFVFPTGAMFGLSLFKWTGFGQPEFVGLDQYAAVLSDPIVYTSLWHNVQIAFLGVAINFGLGLLLALAIKAAYDRLRQFFQTAFLLPMAMMPVAVAFIWSFIYNPSYGAMNRLIAAIPIIDWQPLWLGDPNIALYAIILVSTWQGIGFNAVIWIAGLENIDARLYEAARMDGAGRVQMFRYITMPLLKPIAMFILVLTIIGSLRVFGYYWVMTRGGPGHATEVMVTWIYKTAFMQTQLGRASAMSVILFLVTVVLSLLNFKLGETAGGAQ